MIKFLVDSASDYTSLEAQASGLEFVPLKVSINGTEYLSGINLNSDQFYELLSNTSEFPKTSQPSPQQFVEIFEKVKNDGDELICVLLSSGLSGTYQSACLAKEIVDYDKIYLVDSLAATHMIRMIVDAGRKMASEGLSAQEITDKLNVLKTKVRVCAVLDTLEYLCMGGRLSRVQAAIGEFAKLKPVVSVNDEGKVYVMGKNLGINKSMSYIINYFKNSEVDENYPVYSLYTYGLENPQKFEDKLHTNGIEFAKRLQVGSTIGAHVGPGAYGVLFISK